MSRVDELQAKIEASYRNRQVLVKAFDDEVQRYEKEIASLKAESEKPREWNMFLSPAGCLVPMKYFMQSLGKGGMVECAPITVIEKKPIVVDAEFVRKFYDWPSDEPVYATNKARLLGHFERIGIEARAGDE